MMLILAILAAAVNCRLDLTGRSKVFSDDNFNQHGTTQVVTVSKSPLAYAELEGFGEVAITVKSLKSGTESVVRCRVYHSMICLLWNLEAAQYDPTEEFEVHSTVDVYTSRMPFVSLRLVGSDKVEIGSVDRYGFNLDAVHSVDLLVSFKDMPKDLDSKGKIQFFTFQGFQGKLLTSEYLKMYMKLGNEKVTPLNADRSSTTTLGIGSVMTLIPSDKDYCFDSNCLYSFRLDTMNITNLWFQAVQMGSESTLEINEGSMMVDQLRDNDTAVYIITSSSGDSSWNWRFNLIPVEGNPDMAISGDQRPEKFEDYKWNSTMIGSEDIFITGKEIQKEGLTGNKFYILTKAEKQTTFLMSVTKSPPFAHQHIIPNEPLTGEAQPGEIINYFFRGSVEIPEKIEIFAKIRAISGDPDLYVKSCASYETIPCLVTEEDIKNAEILSKDTSTYFRYSSEAHGDDSKYLEFNCIPDNENYKEFKFKDDKLFSSRTCLFAVAVVGKSTSTHMKSKYIIELKGAKYHQALVPEQGQNFRLEQGKDAFWYVDIDQGSFKNQDEEQYINFKFIIISGDVEVYFSRSFPYPTSENQDKIVIVDNNNTQLLSTIKYASFKGTPSNLKGRYYFSMHATEFIFGSVVCTVGQENLEESNFSKVKEITFGEAVMGSIMAKEGSQLQYYFTLDVPETQDGVEIILQLNSIEGLLDFCVSSEAENLNSWNDCLWKDVNGDGNIIINSDDAHFKKKGKYGVLLIPKYTDNIEGSEYTFTMSLSSGDSYVPLTEGLSYKMAILRSPKILRITFPANSIPVADIYILLTTLDAQGKLESSTRRQDLDENQSTKQNIKSAVGSKASLVYTLRELNESCRDTWKEQAACFVYIKVTPSEFTPYEYSILVYGDDKSVFLNEGAEQSLPMPINAEIELEYTPQTTNKSLSINVFSDAAIMEVTVDVKRAGTTDRAGAVSYVVNDPGTNIVHIPTDVLANLEVPVIRINIVNLDVKKDPSKFTDEMYDTNERITIQVSSGLKRLNHLVPIYETQGVKGMFIYYKFIKPSDTNAMVYLTLYSGEADLYVKKGESQFPDLNTYDLRSNSLHNDELMIPGQPEETPSKDSNKFETYIIGVYSRMASSFQLVASKNSSFLYQQAVIGTLITKEVPPGKSLIVSYIHKFSGGFLIGAHGARNNVTVQYKSHDESKEDDFFKSLPSDSDPGFKAGQKFVTRHRVQPLLGAPKNLQYLVKFTPVAGADYVTFFFENEGDSLSIKGGESMNDILPAQSCQKFNVVYDDEVVDESIELIAVSGEVSLLISKPNEEEVMVLRNDGIKAPKYKSYQVSDIFNRSPSPKGPVNMFKEYQVEVCAKDQESAYTMKTSKPSLTMHRLIPGARFLLSLSPKLIQKVFYHRIHSSTIDSIVVKVDMQTIGKTSNKITEIDQLLNLIDFYYILDSEAYGYDGQIEAPLDKNKVKANILSKNKITDSGSEVGIIKFEVQDGIFVIKGKEAAIASFSAKMQFILNDIYPISLIGKTISHLTPSEVHSYEVIKPPNSTLSLGFSGCEGTTKIEVFKVDPTTDTQKPVRTFTLGGGSQKEEDFMTAGRYQGQVMTVRLTSEESLVKLTNIDPRSNSSVTIDSNLITDENSLTISDYFVQYGNKEVNLLNDVRYGDDMGTVQLVLNHLVPAQGFEKRYKEFHRAIFDYTVYLAREDPQFSSSKQCVIRPDTLKHQVANSTAKRFDVAVKDGKIEFEGVKLVMVELPYDPVNPDYYAFIQAKVTFLGENDHSAEDDAVVIVSSTILIGRPSNLPDMGHPAFLIIAFVCIACIGLGVYRLYKTNKEHQSTENVRRVVEENTITASRQIETIEDDRAPPTNEVELETSHKPMPLDDTL